MSDAIRRQLALQKQRTKQSQELMDSVNENLVKTYLESFKTIEKSLSDLYSKLSNPPTLEDAKKYGRLASLEKQISEEISKLTGKSISIIGNSSKSQWELAFRSSQWAMEAKISASVDWSALPTKAIEDSVLSEVSGAVYSSRIKFLAGKTIDSTIQSLKRALINGNSLSQVSAGLRSNYQSGYSDAYRVMRTEAHRNYSEGNLASSSSFEKLGIKSKKKWISLIDERTRPDHAQMDGEYSDEDGIFTLPDGERFLAPLVAESGTGDPAQIINCRCTYVDEVVDFPQDLGTARDASETFPDYQTWLDEKDF